MILTSLKSSRYFFIAIVLVAGFATGCGSKSGKKSDGGRDPEETSDLEKDNPLALSMPTNGSPVSAVADGVYKLSEIHTHFHGSIEGVKIRGSFSHKLKTPGDIHASDPTERFSDWGSLDRSEKSFDIIQEINLPQSFKAENKKLAFLDKRYYWNKIRSAGGWAWVSSGDVSPNGGKFHKFFTEGIFKDGVYTHPTDKIYVDEKSSSGVAVVNNNNVEFFYTVAHSNQNRVIRIVYLKK